MLRIARAGCAVTRSERIDRNVDYRRSKEFLQTGSLVALGKLRRQGLHGKIFRSFKGVARFGVYGLRP